MDYVKEEWEALDVSNIDTARPPMVAELVDTAKYIADKRMAELICVSQLAALGSQLRRPLEIEGGKLTPSSIALVLSPSGTSKDRTVNHFRGVTSSAHSYIDNVAIEVDEDGEEHMPVPYRITATTGSGIKEHMATCSTQEYGATVYYDGEFSSTLQSNKYADEALRNIGDYFDYGNGEQTFTKDRESRTRAFKLAPINALFVSSYDTILLDPAVKNKFTIGFKTMFARRSIAYFGDKATVASLDKDMGVKSSLESREAHIKVAMENGVVLNKWRAIIDGSISQSLHHANNSYKLSDDAYATFLTARNYLGTKAQELLTTPLTKLNIEHTHSRAVKLAVALAPVMNEHTEISKELYLYCLKLVYSYTSDMERLERTLDKEGYEYLAAIADMTESDKEWSSHDLRKLKLVTGANPFKKMEELAKEANSVVENGYFEFQKNKIIYKNTLQEIVPEDADKVRYCVQLKKTVGVDKKVLGKTKYGFKNKYVSFSQLHKILGAECIYIPVHLVGGDEGNGIRGDENIIGPIDMLVLDVDKSFEHIEQVHNLLCDFKHIIATTSDSENKFKFRVLIKLNKSVTIDKRIYKQVIKLLVHDLFGDDLQADSIGMSQMFYSYATPADCIYTCYDSEGLDVAPYIKDASLMISEKRSREHKYEPSSQEAIDALNDLESTFDYAMYSKESERNLKLTRVGFHCIDLGADLDTMTSVLDEVNGSFKPPLSDEEFENIVKYMTNQHEKRIGE